MRKVRCALGTALLLTSTVAAAPTTLQAREQMPSTILPLKIDRIVVRDGGLVAVGSLGNHTFETPLTLGLRDDNTSGATCPVLDLQLGPIELDLLGLVVETSEICLAITAEAGGGNLLGNLLCQVAGLLDQGGLLDDILDDLTAEELTALLSGLTDLLNAVLGQLTSPDSIVGVGGSSTVAGIGPGADCDVLNLALGPLELDLLGLVVELDDCGGGPVTVDIIAEPGSGRLLGNLLCNLSRLLDRGGRGAALERVLNRILDEILGIVF